MGLVKMLFKRDEHDRVGLIIFFVALLGISLLSEYFKGIGLNWYWALLIMILLFVPLRLIELLLGKLLSQWNKKVNFGFYVIAALVVVLLVTFVF